MKIRYVGLVFCLLGALVCTQAVAEDPQITDRFDESSVPLIEIGGKLLVDLHTDVMLTTAKDQRAVNWYNAGYLWGTFGDFGFAGPMAQYPTVTTVDKVKAVTFDGHQWLKGSPAVSLTEAKDWLKGNLITPASMSNGGDYAVELWAYNPSIQPNECMVSWGTGGSLMYPDAKYAPAGKWHHIVLVQASGKDSLYVDGKLQTTIPAANVAKSAPITLGSSTDGKQMFSGSIAAVRVHETPLTEAQIAMNYAGGIKLGTVFLPHVDPKQPDDATWGKSDNPKYKQLFSPHFRMMWDPVKDVNNIMTPDKTHEMLVEYEKIYAFYEQLGMHSPTVSANKEQRGDGKKYKINICINWDGGAFGGYNGEMGCGYPIHAPGIAHAHELGHSYQTQQMGGLAGNWWETHSSWFSKLFEGIGKKYNYNNAMISNAMFFVSNGRDYYHCFHIFEQLGLEPELGPLFIAKLWNSPPRDCYPFLRAEELFPDKVSLLKDQWVKMARRNITWDYPDAVKNPRGEDYRMSRTLLEPVPYMPGTYRVPKEMAPQQFGYDICPLQPTGNKVTVDFAGYMNPERGSDWRACLVAVNSKGESRYGDIFSKGKSTMTLKPDEKDVYLVVAATPKTMMIEMAGDSPKADYRSTEQSQFPYYVKLTGATPKDTFVPEKPAVPGHAHPNGGGFVADTANVDATAYVGPNAQVLGHAMVLGNARIEDYAVVKDNAVVRDHAVVSGHGLVSDNALVRDYAKVRDFGKVTSKLMNFARVAEHGVNGGSVSEYATVKGCAASFGNNYGTSIVDGGYAKSNEVSKGVWLSWSWGTGKNAGELDQDLGGVYAQYLFDKAHPYLALDTYGVTNGYLVGKPVVANGILTLNGKDQFVEMPKDVADMHDMTLAIRLNWAGGKNQAIFSAGSDSKNCMYLAPSEDGKLSFVMVKDGKGQAIKSDAALPVGKTVDVKVEFSEGQGILYIDDQPVGHSNIGLCPDDIKSTVCYLGRGMDGNFFAGQIDSITVYSIALNDTGAPAPNPAEWRIEPAAYSDSSVIMYAQTGCDPKPGVEYFFTETTGKGHNSGWQTSPIYMDKGLKAGETYTYTVKMRDAKGNETKPSVAKSAKFEGSAYFVADKTPDGKYPLYVMEAEHYQNKVKGRFHEWVPEDVLEGYRGEGAMYSSPEAGPAIGDFMLESPRMDFRFKVDEPGKYNLWTRGIGRYYRSEYVWVSVDGQQPQKAFPGWQNQTYRWKNASADNKPLLPFEIDAPGVHTLSVWMGDDGSSLDAFILTPASYDDYKPTDELNNDKDMVGKGPRESRLMKDGEIVRNRRTIDKPVWSSLLPVFVSETRVVMQAKSYADKLPNVEYFFEDTNSNKNSGWQKEPYYETTVAEPGIASYHYKIRMSFTRPGGNSNGEARTMETGWSDTITAKWDISKAFTEPANGQTVIEAEHFTNKTDAPSGHKWEFSNAEPVDIFYTGWMGDRTDVPHSGDGYMVAGPKDGIPTMGKTLDVKARLDYQINFTKPGTHYVWVRGSGEHWLDHVVGVGLDMKSADWGKVELGWTGMRWVRTKAFEVAQPGVHTLNIWMQQDTLLVDKIIVTMDEKFLPSTEVDGSSGAPNGIGPAETAR